jgi:excisionase family DNA binding protein
MTEFTFATLAAAAEVTGVSPRSIRRYIAAGRLKGYRLGPRLIRVDLDELRDLLSPIVTGTADDPTGRGTATRHLTTHRQETP